jgi:hypothetical protein
LAYSDAELLRAVAKLANTPANGAYGQPTVDTHTSSKAKEFMASVLIDKVILDN